MLLILATLFQEEHERLLKNRDSADSGITWKEYKSMTFTFQVSLRVSLHGLRKCTDQNIFV